MWKLWISDSLVNETIYHLNSANEKENRGIHINSIII